MTDGVLPLLESGVIDNSLKRVMPGVTVASLALARAGCTITWTTAKTS